jgi:hypothetical protein
MLSGSLTAKLRPLRLAFIVPADDRSAVRQAIRICSFLWGGVYNPIIPLYKRRPKSTDGRPMPPAAQLVQGYIEAFDPDFIVRLGSAKQADVALGHRVEIDADEILKHVSEDGTPSYGIGLYEIMDHMLAKEFRFVRRNPLMLHIPQVGDDLFLASIFGDLPEALQPGLTARLERLSEYKSPPCSRSNYYELLQPANLFIRRLTCLKIDPRRSWCRDDYALLLDANVLADILLYWNLRALGWRVIPVPKQSAGDQGVRDFVSRYVEQCFWPLRGNPSIYNHATLLKSPSVPEEELKEFSNSLSLGPIPKDAHWKVSLQTWVPRFWDEWDRLHNRAERCSLKVEEKRFELNPASERFEFPPLVPDFAGEFSHQGAPLCANELELRSYGPDSLQAEVIPEGGDKIVRAIDFTLFSDARCSADGLVYFPKYKTWNMRLAIPIGEAVFSAWFHERGWAVEPSDKGHVTKQLLRQLGGKWGTNWLAEEVVLKLLIKVSKSPPFRLGAFRALVQEAAKNGEHIPTDRLTEWLVDSNIVRLGTELVCPKCRQRSWYSVTEMDYDLQCGRCLEGFRLPCHSPKEIHWAYRGAGAFSVANHMQGGLAVILVLRFFTIGMHDQITPLLSFIARKGEQTMEVVLAILARRMRSGHYEQDTIFVECKSYNEFEKADVRRMEEFSRQFPGAAVIFATLRRELSPKEKKLLTPAVNRGRRLWKAARPFTPILILTGNELFSSHGPNMAWRKLGGRFARFADRFRNHREIVSLADATQQLYLDLEPWEQSLRQKHERRNRQREEAAKKRTV